MANIILADLLKLIDGPKKITPTPLADVFENKNSGEAVVFDMETPAKG